MNKKNKGTALVTGAANRIGRQLALHLAEEGYNIALHYHHSKAEAMHTAQTIYKKNVRCELFCCDLSGSICMIGSYIFVSHLLQL